MRGAAWFGGAVLGWAIVAALLLIAARLGALLVHAAASVLP